MKYSVIPHEMGVLTLHDWHPCLVFRVSGSEPQYFRIDHDEDDGFSIVEVHNVIVTDGAREAQKEH